MRIAVAAAALLAAAGCAPQGPHVATRVLAVVDDDSVAIFVRPRDASCECTLHVVEPGACTALGSDVVVPCSCDGGVPVLGCVTSITVDDSEVDADKLALAAAFVPLSGDATLTVHGCGDDVHAALAHAGAPQVDVTAVHDDPNGLRYDLDVSGADDVQSCVNDDGLACCDHAGVVDSVVVDDVFTNPGAAGPEVQIRALRTAATVDGDLLSLQVLRETVHSETAPP